jgi:hypothetical protein
MNVQIDTAQSRDEADLVRFAQDVVEALRGTGASSAEIRAAERVLEAKRQAASTVTHR